jgi:anti-anti-sigma regulatory factor
MNLTLMPLQDDDVLRVRCDGAVSLRGRGEAADPLQALLGPHCGSHKVLLNLEQAQGIDTSGVCWLVRQQRAFRESGGALVIYSVPPVVGDVLDFLRLTPLLCLAAGEAAALVLARGPDRARDGDAPRPDDLPRGPLRLPG